MSHKALATVLAAAVSLASLSASAAIYHVDADAGDDASDGQTPGQAWKTLARVNSQVFQPGDQILFKAGTHYSGQLKPQGSGTNDNGKLLMIKLGMYGDGPRPRIDGQGAFLDTLLLRNVEYWDVEDLEISNLGTNRAPSRTGVRIVADRFGTMHHIHLNNLFVHDVNGDLRKEREGCGIFFESRGGNASCFDDLLIENCHLVRTDRNGICQRGGSPHSTNIVIRNNQLEDIGGDGIKLWGTDGGLVEHNVIHGGRMRCDDYAAGIWPFNCNDALIQFNEVSGYKGVKDGEGFDSDYQCRRSVFQYNYSHDNDGGFILVCTPGNSFNLDTIIRYNISQNDGLSNSQVFNFGGGAKHTRVYNNTIYLGPRQKLPLLEFGTWNRGNAQDTQFFNNIFYADGRAIYDWGHSTSNIFENNVFYGNHSVIPPDSNVITNRPPLPAPGTGGDGTFSLIYYRPVNAGDFPRGKIIPDNGGRDFFGESVPTNLPPFVGACEPLP
jgi:hypothetical protein